MMVLRIVAMEGTDSNIVTHMDEIRKEKRATLRLREPAHSP